jgi:hypothetical protein
MQLPFPGAIGLTKNLFTGLGGARLVGVHEEFDSP